MQKWSSCIFTLKLGKQWQSVAPAWNSCDGGVRRYTTDFLEMRSVDLFQGSRTLLRSNSSLVVAELNMPSLSGWNKITQLKCEWKSKSSFPFFKWFYERFMISKLDFSKICKNMALAGKNHGTEVNLNNNVPNVPN